MPSKFKLGRISFLWLALVGYYLPWLWHKAAGLTTNAYDLAEWVSIHPAVRSGNPPLVAPFLLRGLLDMLALLYMLRGLRTIDRWRWLYIVIAVVLAITLMPPLDFFVGAFNDSNYQQQFMLSVVTLIALVAIFFLRGRIVRWLPHIEATIAALSILAAIVGVTLAYNVMRSVQLAPTIGGGAVVFAVSLAIYALSGLGALRDSR